MSTKIEQLDLPLYRGKSIKTKQYVEGYLKTCADTGAKRAVIFGYRTFTTVYI